MYNVNPILLASTGILAGQPKLARTLLLCIAMVTNLHLALMQREHCSLWLVARAIKITLAAHITVTVILSVFLLGHVNDEVVLSTSILNDECRHTSLLLALEGLFRCLSAFK